MKVKAARIVAKEPSAWHVFAGRMDPSTTEDDVTEMLANQGIGVVKCRRLPKRETWHDKFAASHISMNINDKDTVLEECIWTDGVEVRDWMFT